MLRSIVGSEMCMRDSTPTAFVSLAVGTLEAIIGTGATIIAVFLPALLIILYLEVLIPIIIRKLVMM